MTQRRHKDGRTQQMQQRETPPTEESEKTTAATEAVRMRGGLVGGGAASRPAAGLDTSRLQARARGCDGQKGKSTRGGDRTLDLERVKLTS